MNEKWKPILYGDLDLTNRFEVSNFGKIRNIKTKKILKTTINQNGYEEICISLGKRKNYKALKIHRCVAFMFVDGFKDGLVVNHIDGIKTNNVWTNLEWVTSKENTRHAIKTGLSKHNKLVMCEQTNEIFNSIREACIWCNLAPDGKSLSEYLNHPEKRKSAGKHPVTHEPLTWHFI